MKCTECSQEIKPVVAIDIDGTLGDYHSHFIRFASAYLGYGNLPDDYTGIGGFKDWALSSWRIDERTWHDIKLAYRQGAQKRSMHAYAGAQWLCERVQAAGAELWLTTTRPYLRLDNIDPDTRHWLELREIKGYTGLLYDDAKYHRLSKLVDPERVVAVVDDQKDMLIEAGVLFGGSVPILRRTRYNSRVAWFGTDFDNLDDLSSYIYGGIQTWLIRHEHSS